MYLRFGRVLSISRSRMIILLMVLGYICTQIPEATSQVEQAQASSEQIRVFMPFIRAYKTPSRFYGVEMRPSALSNPTIVEHAEELGGSFVRLNGVSWRSVQMNEGDPYNWSALAAFDAQLAVALKAGLTPVIVITTDSPTWATGRASTCAAVQSQHFDDFAAFIGALITRYQNQFQYKLDYWEIGNEPDVDPRLVPSNNPYGCWGNIDDPYYGGEHYGNMLKVVAPAIRSVDPDAKVIVGGLLLHAPVTTDAGRGKPERFLEGILRSGAKDDFDIVAYHEYLFYSGEPQNPLSFAEVWSGLGGMGRGKATFLRQVMARYNVSKPLMLNETAVLCKYLPDGLCLPGTRTPEFMKAFFELQADTVAPFMVRVLSEKVESILWYDLCCWNNYSSGLLDTRRVPRPAYHAFRTLITNTGSALDYPTQVPDYGTDVEAYRFVLEDQLVDVVWSPDRNTQTVRLPEQALKSVYDRDGEPISPGFSNGQAEIVVSTSAVYIHRVLK